MNKVDFRQAKDNLSLVFTPHFGIITKDVNQEIKINGETFKMGNLRIFEVEGTTPVALEVTGEDVLVDYITEGEKENE